MSSARSSAEAQVLNTPRGRLLMMNCVPQALQAETALPMLRFIRDTIRAAEMIPFAI